MSCAPFYTMEKSEGRYKDNSPPFIWIEVYLKVVICGKYINLNKITKIQHISLKFNRLLIFVILYSLQCKIEGHAV